MKHLRERAGVLAAVRRFFDARDFVEVQTPVMVPSPGLDLHLDAFAVVGGDRGAPRWLVTSPEYQMKRLVGDGWRRIYQIAPCFRRDEAGPRHNPEFTMVEWYRAHGGVDDVIRDTEQLVAAVTGGAVQLGPRTIDVRPPFARISVCDAFARFVGWSKDETLSAAANDEERYFRALVDGVEPALERMDAAVVLEDYPVSQAALARPKPGAPELAERFEVYVAGVELCNGFGELVDGREQRARLERDQQARRARGLAEYPIDERFVEAVSRMPPTAGNALGLDRLAALACGTTEIASVMAFTADEV
ncbi:MAG TPA: EF-P lysine aminoacylase EpmA [Polyangiaceae bacterium]|nr:EF-P lysine aminoacylase EpmA [Polyangiaceae bacterium]